MTFFHLHPSSLESELHRHRCYTLLNILALGALCAAVCINIICSLKCWGLAEWSLTLQPHRDCASGYENCSHFPTVVPGRSRNWSSFYKLIIQSDAMVCKDKVPCRKDASFFQVSTLLLKSPLQSAACVSSITILHGHWKVWVQVEEGGCIYFFFLLYNTLLRKIPWTHLLVPVFPTDCAF